MGGLHQASLRGHQHQPARRLNGMLSTNRFNSSWVAKVCLPYLRTLKSPAATPVKGRAPDPEQSASPVDRQRRPVRAHVKMLTPTPNAKCGAWSTLQICGQSQLHRHQGSALQLDRRLKPRPIKAAQGRDLPPKSVFRFRSCDPSRRTSHVDLMLCAQENRVPLQNVAF
jgi:hypothetical protein